MADFDGTFKSTTLIGKEDFPMGSSVIKTPQQNNVIYTFIKEPVPTSTTKLSGNLLGSVRTIGQNAQYEKYTSNKYTNILNKIIVSTPEEFI